MLRHGWTKPDELVEVEQGLEVLRPSRLFARSGGTADEPRDVRVGGYCAGAIRGELTLPRARAGPGPRTAAGRGRR